MAKNIWKLTTRGVESAKKAGLHSDGGGLYLSVTKARTKSWAYVWIRKGRRRQMGLGGFPAVSLKEARVKAQEVREQIASGIDPISERKADRAAKTFKDVAQALIDAHRESWKHPKHRQQWQRTVYHYCKPILNMAVTEVETADILKILKPIWLNKPETARRVRSRTERIIDYAISMQWRSGDNPARWKNHLKNLLPEHSTGGHYAALPYSEIPALMSELSQKDTISARALEFTILCAVRTNEALGATWQEIDLDAHLWTIAGHRMKGKKHIVRPPHEVPLSDATIDILTPLYDMRRGDYVFASHRANKPLSNMAMAQLLKRLRQGKSHCTVHGMRSAFRDYCGDKTSFPREIAEAALAHNVGSAVERAYRRGSALDKRRDLMRLWSDYCYQNTSEKVVRLST